MLARIVTADSFVRAALVSALSEAGLTLHSSAALVVWDGEGECPSGRVLALAEDEPQARRALLAGAEGVVQRALDAPRIALALEALDAGLRVIDAAFSGLLPSEAFDRPIEPLSPREGQVLDLLAAGLSNRGIARKLGISESTAKFHVNALLAKLDARNRTDAVVRAARMGLLLL